MTTQTKDEGEVSTFALDVYWAQGRSGDAAVEGHVAGCARCQAYLSSLDGMAAPSARPLLRAATSPRWRRWALPSASAIVLAAAAALVIRGKPSETEGYIGVKGTPAVQLLVHRDRETRIWDGRSALHPGDALALKVACEGLKHVVVASPGGAGWARLSSAACPGHDDPLPFTLRVDGEAGEERLAVVLSQEEIDDGTLQKAIAETRRAADVWVVTFVMAKETETNP